MQELESINEKEIVNLLLIVDASQMHQILLDNVIHFSKNNVPGLFFSTTKPTRLFQDELKSKKIDVQKIIFLESMVDESNEYSNVVFVQTLEDLIGISIALEYFIKEPAEKKYLIVDSLDLLKMYNDQELVINFVSRITQLCSINKTTCVMITSKRNEGDFISKITPSFKKTLFKT